MSAPTAVAALLALALLAAPPQHRRLSKLPSRPRIGRGAALPVIILVATVAMWTPPTVSVTVGLVVLGIELRRRRRRAGRRGRDEAQSLVAALETLVSELRVGAHPLRAFGTAADESAGSVGASLRVVAMRAQLGADVAVGLRSAARGSSVPAYWNRLAVYWKLAAEHGLAMSTLMRTAHRDIVARQRFADRVQAGLAGARATAVILAGLPFLGVALGELIGAQPVRFLLGGGAGGGLLALGVGLVGIGIAWSDHIIDRLAL